MSRVETFIRHAGTEIVNTAKDVWKILSHLASTHPIPAAIIVGALLYKFRPTKKAAAH
ncbi:MAG TPA: hypothetical protein VG965_02555 [Patescibacteria group bacterium]|nr:hypothetical protein [Patescibacteria group bacterium]